MSTPEFTQTHPSLKQIRMNIKRTRDIPNPHAYVRALNGEYADWAFDEERAPQFRGRWRKDVFRMEGDSASLDLEIGTGNGYFFAHRSSQYPERLLVGLEVKFKPLIQSIRRARKNGSENVRVTRFDARFVGQLFKPGEVDHIFVHHPDPWERRRKQKHRLLSAEYLRLLFDLQRPGRYLEIKTDSRDYFDWILQQIPNTPYLVDRQSFDLHSAPWASENFITHFERIFIAQGIPINYIRLEKPSATGER
jgi:tRNA (guanine-N7-)-methyltransferase